jgi:uncharacterized protein DUF5946
MANCPECSAGGILPGGDKTCKDHFDQMLYWEMEDLERFGQVHHLMVLVYHLQHPSLYSPETLAGAKNMLVDFVERGVTPQEVRRRMRQQVSSSNRTWKVTGTPESHGGYGHPVTWTMTAADIVAGGAENYCENVRRWAEAALKSLRESRNL